MVTRRPADAVDAILGQWRRERPDLDTGPMGPIGRLKRCTALVQRHLDENFARFGLSFWEFDVLATLRRSGRPYRLTPTALFSALMVTSGTMTNRLQRLESRKPRGRPQPAGATHAPGPAARRSRGRGPSGHRTGPVGTPVRAGTRQPRRPPVFAAARIGGRRREHLSPAADAGKGKGPEVIRALGVGGAGGNRTPVRKPSTDSSTCLAD
jgi:hypothetical protein